MIAIFLTGCSFTPKSGSENIKFVENKPEHCESLGKFDTQRRFLLFYPGAIGISGKKDAEIVMRNQVISKGGNTARISDHGKINGPHDSYYITGYAYNCPQ